MPWMVGNIVKNLVKRPATRPYPVVKRDPFHGTRGQIAFLPGNCEFCGDCERVCPTQAILLDTVWENRNGNNELVWVRSYDPYRCIYCDLCVEICPYYALASDLKYHQPGYERQTEHGKVEPW
ncbi:MAG: 4Fe-4S dicluster domain-containing protein [Desulforudis sp.]|jgi:formate hydrogenlyase subunit 6/NADH:ubiquinone oxidoreductase subunit I|nr:4Fe-4S dicluster domain-containing protein [Clostridia bacterium]MDQ7791214.1 4Fe-4S dicluster domain-containing protein [Clostridia bacterium]RJX17749.1 MAG: 4Fe-4S dicluster domain-containing protein [Desulforudis sp.]